MASHRRTSITFTLLCNFLLLSSVSSSSISLPSSSHSPKVSLGLYYESLCPYSANFIINHLVMLFQDDLISIIDLHLSPWGNAKLQGNDTFICQLELQYAAETNALQPPHKYVPWVVVEGRPLYEDYENFASYICKAYRGNPTPKLALNCPIISFRR